MVLRIIGESAAGKPFDGVISAGQCCRIFTGAHLPAGADSIILLEDTTLLEENRVEVKEITKQGQYIRQAGQDFASGDLLLKQNKPLTARDLALLAAAGLEKLACRRRPKVAILSTGDELVAPGITPLPHQIISSNGLFLEKLVILAGAVAVPLGIAKDDPKHLDAALEQAAGADLLVTSGGASIGAHDAVAHRMAAGDGLDFWRIAMRPGKPLMFGQLELTKASLPMLGLPGNPVSTAVCGLIFVSAAIRAMLGLQPLLPTERMTLANPLGTNDQRQDYLRARLYRNDDGSWMADPLTKQDSGMLHRLAMADGLIIRPAFAEASAAGSSVEVVRFPAGF